MSYINTIAFSTIGGPFRHWSTARRHALAAAFVGAAGLFRYGLRGLLGDDVPYLQFYPAILAAAWFAGVGPTLLAAALCALMAMYFLLPPVGWAVAEPSDQVALAVFVATGLMMAALRHRLDLAEATLDAAAATATARAERLDAILDNSADGIIVIDARGNIEAFSRGAERLFGYPEREVLGRNVSLLTTSPHHENHDSYLRNYLTTGAARIIGIGREVQGRRRDGSVFPVHLSVSEMRMGGERKFSGMLHDLTGRTALTDRLNASEARWRAVIDSAVDGIIVIDAHGRIESFNPSAERLFGYTQQDVIGRNVDMLMPAPYREEHDTYMSRYLATGRAKIIGSGREVEGLRRDGTTFPLHLSVGEITRGSERKFTGIVHDLTARVAAERQLREQTALAGLGEMAAVIAHEIKNPLAGIRGAIQVVGGRLPHDNPSGVVLREIVNRIDGLDQMMKDLLLFARPPKLRRLQTEIMPLVATTVDLLGQDPSLKELEVELKGSAPVAFVDADLLKIVFHNLLINGAHAMRGKGRIQVAFRTENAACEIAFTDEGPGIPAELREKIFTPFFTTKSLGSGLGLPTARRLIEAHSGHLDVVCPPSGGTTMVVHLPLSVS